MKNYVQPGNTITLTAPYAVAAGDGLLVGSIFGVASGTAALGETVETALVGVYELKKLGSQAWAVGARIYWDNAARLATTVVASNTLIGAATEPVAGGANDTIDRVRLNSIFWQERVRGSDRHPVRRPEPWRARSVASRRRRPGCSRSPHPPPPGRRGRVRRVSRLDGDRSHRPALDRSCGDQ